MKLIENLLMLLSTEGGLAACLLVFIFLAATEIWCLINMIAGFAGKIVMRLRHRRAERNYPYDYVFQEINLEEYCENRRIEKMLERANLKIRMRRNMVG